MIKDFSCNNINKKSKRGIKKLRANMAPPNPLGGVNIALITQHLNESVKFQLNNIICCLFSIVKLIFSEE